MPSVIFTVAGLLLFLWDYVGDILVAIKHFYAGDYVWAALTVLLIVVPALVVGTLLFKKFPQMMSDLDFNVSTWLSCTDVVLLVFGCSPFVWAVCKIFFSFKWRRRQFTVNQDNYNDLCKIACLIGECQKEIRASERLHMSLESGPQLLLQVYIVLSSDWEGFT